MVLVLTVYQLANRISSEMRFEQMHVLRELFDGGFYIYYDEERLITCGIACGLLQTGQWLYFVDCDPELVRFSTVKN